MYCEYSLTLFNGEDRHARGLLSLVPSLFLYSSVNPDEYINDMLKWEYDLLYPKSLGSEVEGTSKHPIPACCWLHLTYIKCRSRTILLLNEKDQDIRKIGYERFSDLALISMHYKERVPTTMKFARHLCRPIPENCFKHPYLTIVVHRSSNSCNRNLINTTQFYVVLI